MDFAKNIFGNIFWQYSFTGTDSTVNLNILGSKVTVHAILRWLLVVHILGSKVTVHDILTFGRLEPSSYHNTCELYDFFVWAILS